MESNQIVVSLDQLYLDPNNYRFIDKSGYLEVSESQAKDEKIQTRSQSFIIGQNQAGINDLISSFKTNGFLAIDQIQVKKIEEGKYLVLEGNRRVSTLKYLYQQWKDGLDVGLLNEQSFSKIKVVQILDEDPVQHLITMGLHHISGKRKWSPVNEAQLIHDLIHKYGKQEVEITQALGISTNQLRRSLRTLALIQDYKKSDYGDQFRTDMFSIFEAIVSNPTLKEWIEWDDFKMQAGGSNNLERFYGWISQTEETNWDSDVSRKKIVEPVITQYRQVKQIVPFIYDEKALAKMEETGDINQGYTFSKLVGESKVKEAVDQILSYTKLASNFKELFDEEVLQNLILAKDELEVLIPYNKVSIQDNARKAILISEVVSQHYT